MTLRLQNAERAQGRGLLAIQVLCVVVFLVMVHRQLKLDVSNMDTISTLPTIRTAASSTIYPQAKLGYQLAKQQSFGFFNDTHEETWRVAQEIKQETFPNFYGPSKLRKYSNEAGDRGDFQKLRRSSWWNGENFQVEFHCPLARRLPSDSQADGPKWVCDPHRLKSKPRNDPNVSPCLVYSVGSNGKAEFEKGVRDTVGDHCEIHTFDMETYNKRNGHFDKALEGYATFHSWGLGTEKEAAKKSKRFKTLEQTMIELGHVGRTIDIFKIDCEWCEWFTFRQWLSQDIRQILVETHNAPMPEAQEFFFELHDAGYVIFSKEANYQNDAGGVEFGFLKLSTDFLGGKLYKDLAM